MFINVINGSNIYEVINNFQKSNAVAHACHTGSETLKFDLHCPAYHWQTPSKRPRPYVVFRFRFVLGRIIDLGRAGSTVAGFN